MKSILSDLLQVPRRAFLLFWPRLPELLSVLSSITHKIIFVSLFFDEKFNFHHNLWVPHSWLSSTGMVTKLSILLVDKI